MSSALEKFKANPKDTATFDALAQSFAVDGSWEELAQLHIIRAEALRTEETAEAARQFLEAAKIYREHLGDRGRAKRAFAQVLTFFPVHRESFKALEDMYIQDEEWQKLIELYENFAQALKAPNQKADFYHKAGKIWDKRLNVPEKAIACYQKAHSFSSDDLNILADLESICIENQYWEEAVSALESHCALEEERRTKCRLYARMGEILARKINDPVRAARCYREILAIGEDAATLNVLADLYAKAQDWTNLAVILERKLNHASSREERVEICTRLARIMLDHMGAHETAIGWYRRAISEAPQDRKLIGILRDLFESLGRTEEWIQCCRQDLELMTSNEEKIATLTRIAGVLADNAYDLKRAAQTYEEILPLDPQNMPTIDALKRIYLTLEDYESLVRTLYREVELTAAEDQIPLYFRIAEILSANLAREQEAVPCYHKILQIDWKNQEANRKLRDYYTRHRMYAELIEVIKREIQVEPDKALKRYLEIGGLYRDRLKQKEEAIQAYEKALQVDSRCIPALVALRALYRETKRWNDYIQVCLQEIALSTEVEHILKLHFALAELHLRREELDEAETHFAAIIQLDMANTRALQSIKEIYSAQGKWPQYIQILEREAHLFGDHHDLAQRYGEIAELYRDTLHNRKQAIYYYERAATLDPHDLKLLKALEKEYLAEEQYEKLVAVLEAQARLTTNLDLARDLRVKIGLIWEEKIRNPPYAIEAYQRVLAMEPFHLETLKRLEKLHASRQEYEDLVKILQQQTRVIQDKGILAALHMRLGRLAETELADSELAVENYRRVLTLATKHEQAIEALITIFERDERWEELADIYTIKLAALPDEATAIATLFKLAHLYIDRLEALDKAAATYRDILALEPSNIEAIHALQAVSKRLCDFPGLLDALKQETEYTQDRHRLVLLYVAMGTLCEETLHDYEEGIRCYQKVLTHLPDHLESVQALHRMYTLTHRYQELVQLLDKEKELTPNPAAKVSLLIEKGTIARDRLDAIAEAIQAFREVLRLAPSSPEALRELELLYRRQKSYAELIAILERRCKLAEDEQRKNLLLEIARVWEDYLGEDAKAEQALIEAMAIDPGDRKTLNALAAIYRRAKRWDDVIRILETELAHTEKPDRRVQIYFLIGKIWEDHLKDTSQAVMMYEKLIRLDRHNFPALKSLQRIHKQEKRYDALVKVYLTELNIPDISPELKITINIECAQILEEHLDERARAITHYRNVLHLAPENLIAIRGLQDLYRKDQADAELAEMLEKELLIEQEARRLFCVHVELGRLYRENLEMPQEAIRHLVKAHELRPRAREVLSDLVTLLGAQENWEEYVLYREKELALNAPQAKQNLALHLDLGEVYEWKLGNLDMAVQHLEKALELDRNCLKAIHNLQRLYQRKNQVAQLVRMYQLETELATQRERLLLLHHEAGMLCSSVLSKPLPAINHFREVVAIDPHHKNVIQTLSGLYSKLSKWKELAALYQLAMRSSTSVEEKIDWLLKAAALWRKRLGNDARSMALYQTALTLMPDNLPAIRSMRRILEQHGDWHGAIEMLKREIPMVETKEQVALYLRMGENWERLKLLYQALGAYQQVLRIRFHMPTAKRMLQIMEQLEDYQGLASLLEKVIKGIEDPAEKANELCRLGTVLYRRLSMPDKAIEAFVNALKFDARKIEAIVLLEEILTRKESWQNLVTIKERKLELVSEPEQQRRLYYELGQIYENRLYKEQQAIKNYEKALALTPDDFNVILPLCRLYREWGFFEELVRLRQREVKLVKNQARQIELLTEIGEIWETRLFDDTKAINSFAAILKLDSEHEVAIKSLARLYERTENAEQLLEIQKLQLALAEKKGDQQEVLHLMVAIGRLLAYSLKRPKEAIDIFEGIITQDPSNIQALEALEDLYGLQENHVRLAMILEQIIRTKPDQATLITKYLKLAPLYEDQLQQPEKAIEAYVQVRKLQWDNPAALAGLRRLYKQRGCWQELVETTRQAATATADPEQKAALCTELGELWRDKLQELERAQENFEKALRVLPGYRPALEALIEIYADQEIWEKVIDTLTIWEEHTQDPSEKVRILTWRGNVLLKHMGKEEEAIRDFQRAIDIDPENIGGIRSLAEIYYSKGIWEKAEPLYDQLSRRLEKEATEEAAEIFFRQGRICEQLGRKEEAILKYRRSMGIFPKHLPALEALGNLYYECGQWDPALPIYIKIHNLKGGTGEGITEVHLRLAVIKDKMGMADGALEGYLKVLQVRPADPLCLQSLARLYMERNEEDQALVYLGQLARTEDPQLRREALQTIAKINEEMEEPLKALRTYEELLRQQGENPEILEKLANLYIQVGKWQAAAEKAQQYLKLLSDTDAKLKGLLLLGRIYEGMQNYQEAISYYRKALVLAPIHLPTIRSMARIYSTLQKWPEVVNIYKSYLKALPPKEKEAGIPIQMSLAYTLSEKMNDLKGAIAVYRKILDILPDHVGAHAALAALQARSPSSHEGAVSEHIYLLLRDPLRCSSYHELFQIYREGKEPDRALLCCRVLRFLGELWPDEQNFLARERSRKAGRLDQASILFFLPQEGKGILFNFLSQIDPYTEKAFPPQLEERYGLRKRDRLGPESGELIRAFVSDVMKSLGITDISLYLDSKEHAVLENTQPPSFIVGRKLLSQLQHDELRFVLGKYLFYVALRHVMAAKLSAPVYAKYVMNFVEAFADTGRERSAEDEALSRKLRSGLPRKLRKSLEERLDLLTEVHMADPQVFRNAMEVASNRCGYFFSDSIEASVSALMKLTKRQNLRPRELPEVADLLRFNLSEEYSKLRMTAGLAAMETIMQ